MFLHQLEIFRKLALPYRKQKIQDLDRRHQFFSQISKRTWYTFAVSLWDWKNQQNKNYTEINSSFINLHCSYLLKYQTITKPIKANNNPLILNWFAGNFSITFNIFFIFDGNKAYSIPSMNNKRPIAMMSSFIELIIVY